MMRIPRGEVRRLLRTEAIFGAEGLSPELMLGSLWRDAGEGRGLLYARRAMSVKPARRRVRSAVVISEGTAVIRGLTGPRALVFIICGLVYQRVEAKLRG